MALVELVELDRADGWSLWRAARLAALADAPDAFPGASAEWADGGETRWRERLLDTTALKVVAVRDGVPAGLVRGVVEDGCAWLHSLWVSPQVRGQGLGNQLVAAVEEWAARQGATYIRLEVVPDNAPAIALYRRHGYVDTGVLGELLPDGDRELAMEKSFRAVGPIGATPRNSRLINSRPCQLQHGSAKPPDLRKHPALVASDASWTPARRNNAALVGYRSIVAREVAW